MSGVTYPTDIVLDDEGWARIHQGHGLDKAALLADYNGALHPVEDVRVQEVHLTYQPRVMWCERHGNPCDSNGEWHGHWHGVQPSDNPDTKFTIVFPLRAGAR